MQQTGSSPPYTDLYNNEADARRLQGNALWAYGLLYGHVLLCVYAVLPEWTLLLSTPILIVRWLLGTHELFHLRDHKQVDLLTRLMPLLLTPFSLGYREYQSIHQDHHRYMASLDDPEYFQLKGSPVRGLLNAMSAPEQALSGWIGRERPDAELIFGAGLRGLLFICLAWFCGPVFFWYWLPARLAFGLAYFTFFYVEHRRGEAYGVYPLPLPERVRSLLSLIFGREAMLATCHHDMHHRYPRVSAYHLPMVARREMEDGKSAT